MSQNSKGPDFEKALAELEGLVERLDRQADALRTMCAAYAQRETELGSLVDGLARLRAYPAPTPTDRL